MRLLRLLADRGDTARGLLRNPDHAADLEGLGAVAVVCDLERADDDELDAAVEGSDAVVFAAGAGPGSGPERKRTVDYGGAVKLIGACERTGVERYVMVSAIGVDRGPYGDQMRPYYEAKRDADEALSSSGLAYTIVRPGGLTDDPGTGHDRGRHAAGALRRGHPRRRRRDARRRARRARDGRAHLRPPQRRHADRKGARLAALRAGNLSRADAPSVLPA